MHLAKLLHPIARLVGRLRRSTAKRIHRVTAESVTLGSDFGLNWSDWEAFVARRLSAAGLRSPERRLLRTSAEQGSGRRLWLVFVTTAGDSPASLAASLAAARRLEVDAAFDVACITAGQELETPGSCVEAVPSLTAALRRPGADDLVALLRPGDVLRSEFAVAAVVWAYFNTTSC